jgi:hypothetical protein
MNSLTTTAHRTSHRFGECCRVGPGASRNNCGRHPARTTLLSVLVDAVRELVCGPVVDDVSGGERSALIHPHVYRTRPTERKTTTRVVELRRRHAEVSQNAMDLRHALIRQQSCEAGEPAVHRHEAIAEALQTSRGPLESIFVSVDTDDSAV